MTWAHAPKIPRILVFLALIVGLQEAVYWVLAHGGFGYELNWVKYCGGTVFRSLCELQLALLLWLFPPVVRVCCIVILHLWFALAVGLWVEGQLLLTPSLFRSNLAEGLAIAGNGFSLGITTSAVFLMLLCSLVVAVRLARNPREKRHLFPVAILLLLLLGLDCLYVKWIDPPERIRSYIPAKRLMFAYGYPGLMLIDARYLAFSNAQAQYERYLEKRLPSGTPRPFWAALPQRPKSVYLVQWESLDTRIFKALPNLQNMQDLWRQIGQQYLKVEHINGSSDTDYTILTGLPAPRNMNAYMLEPTGEEQNLAKSLTQSKYSADFVHCNTSGFFSRGQRINDFGFTRSFWSETFGVNKQSKLFWGLDDKACVQHILQDVGLRANQFLYFITLTSHYPYRNIRVTETSKLSTYERYFAEIRNTAEAVGGLIQQIPTGSLLVLYGDHPAMGLGALGEHKTVPLLCGVKLVAGWQRCRKTNTQNQVLAIEQFNSSLQHLIKVN